MKTIWEYKLEFNNIHVQEIEMPVDSKILKVHKHFITLIMWAEVDDMGTPLELRYFKIFGTGWAGIEGKHIDTFFDENFVWHLYEIK